jgi:hypothetical protein
VDLLAAWLLYPLALACLCLGLALLLERLTDWRTPDALLLPIGFAALLVLARLMTSYESTARLALPVIGALALGGLGLGRRRLLALRPDPWAIVAIGGIFALLAAPVVLSGEPSFAGYLALPDTSHQLALAAQYSHHGPDLTGLPDGSNRATIVKYVTTSYPVGGQVTLGVTAPLGALDIAWLYQPFLAFAVLVLSLAIWSLSAPLLARRWQVAVVTFAASQSALLIGNYLLGSIKEITAIAVLMTLIALVTLAITERRPLRSLLPVALAAAAALLALGPAVLPYLVVPGLTVAGVWGVGIVRRRRIADLAWIAAGAALLALFALPALRTLQTAVTVSTSVLVDLKDELGHLAGPLQTTQVLGIWLSGDFRYATDSVQTPQAIALWIAGIAAIVGVVWAIRGRRWGPLMLLATFVPASVYLLHRGTTYADSKVLLIASPAVLLLAMLGAASLWTGRWRALSAVVTAVLVAGILWSTALAYHDVSLAPRARYAELLKIDDRLAGHGPAIFGEYDEFADYFLRKVPVYASPQYPHRFREAPYHPNALRDPKRRPSEKTPIDSDDLTLAYVESVPYVILRRGPQTSRPPANFSLVSRGTYYDVWHRSASGPRVLAHVPLGPDVLHQAAKVSEPVARRLALRARRLGGRIAYAPRERPPVFFATHHPRPLRWTGFGNFPEALLTDGPSNIHSPVRIRRSGRYHVWVEGSFARRLVIGVDGRPLPGTPEGLNNPGAYASLGTVSLRPGLHDVSIRQGGGDLSPGTGGYISSLRHIGPIFFEPVADERFPVREIDASRWRELVGRRADWLEVVRGARR